MMRRMFLLPMLLLLLASSLSIAGIVGTYRYTAANRAANRVKCAAGLRQIGKALLLYGNGPFPRTPATTRPAVAR